jgi:hypothetical protein
VLFVLLFLFARSLRRAAPLSPRERRANARLRGELEDEGVSRRNRYFELRDWMDWSYRRISMHRSFEPALIAGFVTVGVGDLLAVAGFAWVRPESDASVRFVEAAASIASTVLIWIGIVALRKSRVAAFVWFQRSMLVNIFVTQVFVFYDSQLGALGGLTLHLAIYAALRYALWRETDRLPADDEAVEGATP